MERTNEWMSSSLEAALMSVSRVGVDPSDSLWQLACSRLGG